MSKYKSKKVEYQDRIFDSKFECTYYAFLPALVEQGKITNTELQARYCRLPR